jgi:hypothetical protein
MLAQESRGSPAAKAAAIADAAVCWDVTRHEVYCGKSLLLMKIIESLLLICEDCRRTRRRGRNICP